MLGLKDNPYIYSISFVTYVASSYTLRDRLVCDMSKIWIYVIAKIYPEYIWVRTVAIILGACDLVGEGWLNVTYIYVNRATYQESQKVRLAQ